LSHNFAFLQRICIASACNADYCNSWTIFCLSVCPSCHVPVFCLVKWTYDRAFKAHYVRVVEDTPVHSESEM